LISTLIWTSSTRVPAKIQVTSTKGKLVTMKSLLQSLRLTSMSHLGCWT